MRQSQNTSKPSDWRLVRNNLGKIDCDKADYDAAIAEFSERFRISWARILRWPIII
jgi:hypothetical protein